MAEQHKTYRNGWFSNLFRAAPESALSAQPPLTPSLDPYFEATTDGLLMVTLEDGLILKANPAAERLLGYAPKVLNGLHFSKVLPPSTASEHTLLQQRFQERDGICLGQAFSRADGSEIPCDLLITLTQTGERRIAVMNLRDASEREVRSTSEREAIRVHADTEAIREAARQKDQFISKLAHQLRTPLAVIHSAAGMVLRYYERLSVEKRAEHLTRIQTHSHLAATFIEDLRLLNRIEAGEQIMRAEHHDLSELTQLVLKPYQSHPNQPHIIFSAPHETMQSVKVDELVYMRLVDKLVSNAVLYSPHASTIHITLTQQPDHIALTIIDTGIGIPPEFVPQAFDAYQRGSNIGEVDGMGVGLTVARACARLLGGTLTLMSVLGGGTTAKISLPSSP